MLAMALILLKKDGLAPDGLDFTVAEAQHVKQGALVVPCLRWITIFYL